MSTLDDLRNAAVSYAEARTLYSGIGLFMLGRHTASVTAAKKALDSATRSLITASDLHAARGRDGLADLIRSGHTIESAKRVMALRGERTAKAGRTFKKRKAKR